MPFEISATADLTHARAAGAWAWGLPRKSQRALHAVQAHPAYSQGVAILIDARDLATRRPLRKNAYSPDSSPPRFPVRRSPSRRPLEDFTKRRRKSPRYRSTRGAVVAAVHEQVCRARVAGDGQSALDADADADVDQRCPDRRGEARAERRGHPVHAARTRSKRPALTWTATTAPLRLDSASGRPVFEPEVAEVTVSTEIRRFATSRDRGRPRQQPGRRGICPAAVVNAMRRRARRSAGLALTATASTVRH